MIPFCILKLMMSVRGNGTGMTFDVSRDPQDHCIHWLYYVLGSICNVERVEKEIPKVEYQLNIEDNEKIIDIL